MVDMAHFAGLVAAGLHPNPVPYADVVTTTIHKTLGGARGGMILCREEYAKKINSARLPRPAGRPARARDRRQGGRAQDRAVRALPRAPGAHRGRRQGGRRGAAAAPATASTCSPAAPTCTSCSSTCASPSSTASRPRTACTTSASPSTATRCRSTRARRRSRPACASARSALATRGVQADDFQEIGRIIAQALQPGFESVRGELAERVTAIADALSALRAARVRRRRSDAPAPRCSPAAAAALLLAGLRWERREPRQAPAHADADGRHRRRGRHLLVWGAAYARAITKQPRRLPRRRPAAPRARSRT